jgi:hypothetical protein
LKGDPGNESEDRPEFGPIVLQDEDQDVGRQRPEQDVEGVVGEEIAEIQDDALANDGHRSQHLGHAAPPELARDETGQDDRRCTGQSREKTQLQE